jgi:hypothetical protein
MSTPAVTMYLQGSDQVFAVKSTEPSNLQFAAAADTTYFLDASLYVSNTIDIIGVYFSVLGPSNATGTWEVSTAYGPGTGTTAGAFVKPTPINGTSPFTNFGMPTPLLAFAGKCSVHLTARVQTPAVMIPSSAIISINLAAIFPTIAGDTTLYADSVMLVYSIKNPIPTTPVDPLPKPQIS